MGFGVNEKIEKQAKFEKGLGKSKAILKMKTSKKQPKNVSKIVKRKES